MLSTRKIQCPQFLLDKAKPLARVPAAVVHAGTGLILESARAATDQGLIEPVLVGDPKAIASSAQKINWDISVLRVVAASSEEEAARISVALAFNQDVALLMKGNIHTDTLLRAVLDKEQGLRTKRRLSHTFHMTVPESDKVIYITDAVINVLPTLETKLDIVRNAVHVAHALGNPEPKVAVLSATEQITPAMPSSEDAAEITRLAKNGGVEGAIVYGPLAFDLAVSSEAASIKGIDNEVVGDADILLVPNIETGNALFKQMVYFMSAVGAGVVMGAKVPIVLTSRADSVAARLASTAVACIVAHSHQESAD